MSETDVFWRSEAVRRGIVLCGTTFLTAFVAAFAWNMSYTAELGGTVKSNTHRIDRQDLDLQEIKADIKTLLRRIP